jgi:hypothetical protein
MYLFPPCRLYGLHIRAAMVFCPKSVITIWIHIAHRLGVSLRMYVKKTRNSLIL